MDFFDMRQAYLDCLFGIFGITRIRAAKVRLGTKKQIFFKKSLTQWDWLYFIGFFISFQFFIRPNSNLSWKVCWLIRLVSFYLLSGGCITSKNLQIDRFRCFQKLTVIKYFIISGRKKTEIWSSLGKFFGCVFSIFKLVSPTKPNQLPECLNPGESKVLGKGFMCVIVCVCVDFTVRWSPVKLWTFIWYLMTRQATAICRYSLRCIHPLVIVSQVWERYYTKVFHENYLKSHFQPK